jgi:hypothetical protein
MRPFSSVSGMNWSGATTPNPMIPADESFMPMISPLFRANCGW